MQKSKKRIVVKNKQGAELFPEKTKLSDNKTYFIKTYGCQLNENDSEKIAGTLESIGFSSAENMDEAGIIVMNTCTVRENANDKIYGNLGIVKNIKDKDPDKAVILCGCMMKEKKNKQIVSKKYRFVDIIFGPSDIHKLPELLKRHLQEGEQIEDVGEEDFLVEGLPVIHKKKFRALSTIIYGCNNSCSYCIVPTVRGKERSRDLNDILDELRTYGNNGYKEVMLLGQNVNSYGQDRNSHDFADLLRRAGEISSIKRIRFMTSHPKDISKKLIDVISETSNVMPHLHLPLQSGSDRVLKLMNRGYTTGQFYNAVRYAREKIPDISITTDIIVGFPGETEEDFIQTLTFMGKIRFNGAFTFQYSKREGTLAADMEHDIPEHVVKRRFEQLVQLQNSCSFASNQSVVNTFQEVLTEGVSSGSKDKLTGRTPHNRLVNFTAEKDLSQNPPQIFEGKMAKVKITEAKTFSLEGKLVKWL